MPRTTPVKPDQEKQSLITLARTINANNLVNRSRIRNVLGQSYQDTAGARRNLYEALGYDLNITFNMYLARYLRQDIAQRIIEAPVEDSWRLAPEITEDQDATKLTAFEEAWVDLQKKRRVYHYMERADKISGIGRFGGLFMGFKGDGKLDVPVTHQEGKELLFLQPYSESSLTVKELETDIKSERYNLPLFYQIKSTESISLSVHHSRIIHIAENLLEDDVYGQPRLMSVWNRLEDIERVVGGSAEMFWRGAFPGLAFILDEDAEIDETGTQSKAQLEEEIRGYIHGLQRTMRFQAMKVQELKAQVVDPSNHLESLLKLVSAATKIPNRILTGSERGALASTQDADEYDTTIDTRRTKYNEPTILRPFIDRMIEFGVLPEPAKDYEVRHLPLQDASDLDAATVGAQRAEALAKYAGTASEGVLPVEMFLEYILRLDQPQIEKAMKIAAKWQEDENKETDEDKQFEREMAERAMAATEKKNNGGNS